MRSYLMFVVLVISMITALSLGGAFAEKGVSNTTQPTIATNATTNMIDLQSVVEQLQSVTMQLQNLTEQLQNATKQQNVTKIQSINKLQNSTNPFAKVKGKIITPPP